MVKSQVHKLHTELWKLYQERSSLVSKLELAQNSKELILQIQRDLKFVQLTAKDAERMAVEAELALSSSRADNDIHEQMLERKTDTMQTLHWQLDESARKHDEFESLERAEIFWLTSRASLKSAYMRFKTSVYKRIRLSHVRRTLENFRCRYLGSLVIDLWKGFVTRRKFMHMNDMSRMVELLQAVLGHWKVHTMVERLSSGSKRRHLLQKVFLAWANNTKSQQFEKWAVIATERFKQKRRLRRAFSGWEKLCMIKLWRNPRLESIEKLAIVHFLRRIIRVWREQASISQRLLYYLSKNGMQTLLQRRLLLDWKAMCQARWRRRGRLLKRFINNCRNIVRQSSLRNSNRYNAIALWAWLNKRTFLRRWTHRLKNRSIYGRGRHSSRRLGHYRNKRVLLSGFLAVSFGSAALKRQRICMQTAVSHYVFGTGREVFRVWHHRARMTSIKKSRIKMRHQFVIFRAWQEFVRSEKRARRIILSVERLLQATHRRVLQNLFVKWWRLTKRIIFLQRSQVLLHQRNAKFISRRSFSYWKCKWASQMYQRSKELTVDTGELRTLAQLKRQEIDDLAEELRILRKSTGESECIIVELQTQLDIKEASLRKAEDTLMCRKRDKELLEMTLRDTKQLLDEATEERQRLRSVEKMLAAEKVRDAAALEDRKREAEKIMNKLVAESVSLRAEADAARLQAHQAEQTALNGVEREEALLHESQEAALVLDGMARQREAVVQKLTLEQRHLEDELERVQRRLDEFVKSGAAMVDEDENVFRQRTSELRVIRTEAGLAEARVAELQQMTFERRERAAQASASRTYFGEKRFVYFFRLCNTHLILFIYCLQRAS